MHLPILLLRVQAKRENLVYQKFTATLAQRSLANPRSRNSSRRGGNVKIMNSFLDFFDETIPCGRAELSDWYKQRLSRADSRCLGRDSGQLFFQSDISADYYSHFFIVS